MRSTRISSNRYRIAAQQLSALHTGSDAVHRTVRQLLASEDRRQEPEQSIKGTDISSNARDVGRRRAKHSAGRSNGTTAPMQSKHLIRQRFAEKLELEYQGDLKALESATADSDCLAQRHFLVRELISLLRRFNNTDIPTTADGCRIDEHGSDETRLVEAAWKQYCKIKQHPGAIEIVPQIPLTSLGLLICELNFMADSNNEYLVRFTRIVTIFRDFSLLGRPITAPLLFSMYLRALNKLGNSQSVIQEVNDYKSAMLEQNSDAVLSASIMRQLIAAYFGTHNPGLALQTFEHARSDPRYANSITPHIYTTVIGGVLRSRCMSTAMLVLMIDDLLELLQTPVYHDSVRTGVLNELLHLANKHGSPILLLEIFERFASRDMPISYTTFGILLHSACGQETDARLLHRVYQLLVSKTQMYEQLSHHVFAVFINSFVRQDRVDYALMVVRDLRDHASAQLMPQHLSHIFAYYAVHGMASQSLGLLHQMINSDGLQPTWPICVDVAKAIARDDSMSLDDGNSDSNGDGSGTSEDTMLSILVKSGMAGRVSQMLDTFHALRKQAPGSIMPFVAVLLRAHEIVRREAADPVSHRYRWTENLNHEEKENGASSSMDHDEFVRQMQTVRDGIIGAFGAIKFPRNLYNMAISIFAMLRDHDSVNLLYTHMTETEGMEPNTRTFNVLLQAFARGHDLDTAKNLLLEIKYNKVHLNVASGLALIYASFAAKNSQSAIDVYAYLVGRPLPLVDHVGFKDFAPNRPVDVYIVALLIKGLVQDGLLKEAVIVFDDAFGLLPHVPRQLLETLVGALEESSYFDFAHLCLKRYARRVEDSQPATRLQDQTADGTGVSAAATPDHLPLSYFGYLLDGSQKHNDEN
ncbi:hypothetical protein IWW45_006696 [Coemansia sp. RSA 485]|nr:hypothetical protein IWW45_006696 [Coemansia sp. RSA 485]